MRAGEGKAQLHFPLAVALQASTIATQIIVGIGLARSMSVADRGSVIAALLITGLSVSLLAGGLSAATAQAASLGESLGNRFVATVLTIACVSGPVTALVVNLTPGVAEATWVWQLLVLGPLGVLGTCGSAVASGTGRFLTAATIQFAPPVTALVALIALELLGRTTTHAVVSGYVAGNALAVLLTIVSLRANIVRLYTSSSESPQRFKRFVRQAAWMHPSSVSQLIGLRADTVMLAFMGGPSALSRYNVATSYSSALQLPNILLRGRMIARGPQTLDNPARITRSIGLWLGVGGSALLMALPIIPVVYGEHYNSAMRIAAILIVAGILLFIRDIQANTLMGAGYAKHVALIEGALALTSIPVYGFAIYFDGAEGAAIGSIAVYGSGVALFWMRIRMARHNRVGSEVKL